MTNWEKVAHKSDWPPKLRRRLVNWYSRSGRDLPWRRTNDPYAIWVSEIMLQQTRVETVLRYYDRFLSSFPTVTDLANAEERELLVAWEGLGYYRRARNLHKAAKVVVTDLDGELPTSADQWQELPGIGRYTAAAIASITRGEPKAVLDGNVKRVLARLLRVEKSIDLPAVENQLWEEAERLLDVKNPGDHNQAMMELGARICLPKNPNCEACPIAKLCVARAAGVERTLPVRKAKEVLPVRHAVALILRRSSDGALLIRRRDEGELLAGLWEFPQAWVKETSSVEDAFSAFLQEVAGKWRTTPKKSLSTTHIYTHFRLELSAELYELAASQEEKLKQRLKFSLIDRDTKTSSSACAWLTTKNRGDFPIHRAHQKLLEQL